MRELTVNRKHIKLHNSRILYTVEKQEGGFVFTTPIPHCLTSESKVILRKEYVENELIEATKQLKRLNKLRI